MFAVTTLALILGVHLFVDDLSDASLTGDKAALFTPADGTVADDAALKSGVTYGLAGLVAVPGAAQATPGGQGMDPEMSRKADQMRKRYADRLSRMSAQDKMRALNKVSKLFGTDARSLPTR